MKSDLYRLSQKYHGRPAKKSAYARGGSVRRHFDEGGLNTVDFGYDSGQADPTGGGSSETPTPAPTPAPAAATVPQTTVTPAPAASPTAAPAAVTPGAAPSPDNRMAGLEALLSRYTPPSNEYARELAESRRRAQTETEAFTNMIRQMSERGESPTSRAEMYFRLAAAFGSPTKTGKFTENLALAGKEMSEYAKGRRTEESERRNLALKAQEIRMAGARQDLTTTQTLAAQEAAERRAIQREILKEHLASGRPQSEAGKIAQDAGLTPGTPQYGEFVDRYIRSKLESGELYKQAMLGIQEANLQLRKAADERKIEAEKQLTPPELRMKQDSENSLNASRSALRNINRALEINPNTFSNSIVDYGRFQALYNAGDQSPRVLNTAEMRNILSEAAIGRLRESFGAGITNEERRALVDLQGALSRSPAERLRILERTRGELQRSVEREERRLRDISSGVYRRQTPAEGAGETQ